MPITPYLNGENFDPETRRVLASPTLVKGGFARLRHRRGIAEMSMLTGGDPTAWLGM